MPTVTSVSVTARPVVLTVAVAGPAPNDGRGRMETSGRAAAPISSLRRSGDCRPLFGSSDMSTPFLFENADWSGEDCPQLCTAQIRGIAYIAPQNSDVGFGTEFAGQEAAGRTGQEQHQWQGGSG